MGVQGQPGLHIETLSPVKKKRRAGELVKQLKAPCFSCIKDLA